MWTLKQLQDPNWPVANINGKWVPARPLNYQKKYLSLRKRIAYAWDVITGKTETFTWPEGQ